MRVSLFVATEKKRVGVDRAGLISARGRIIRRGAPTLPADGAVDVGSTAVARSSGDRVAESARVVFATTSWRSLAPCE
ncbi:hypothetical protein MTO96_046356 [Rhipicephalus appendiculatus]